MSILRDGSHHLAKMFDPCLTVPRDPYEARLVADALESLTRALREWPADAWRQVGAVSAPQSGGPDSLFERLVARARPLALDPRQREEAIRSAEAVAAVLRVLWPEARAMRGVGPAPGETAMREPAVAAR